MKIDASCIEPFFHYIILLNFYKELDFTQYQNIYYLIESIFDIVKKKHLFPQHTLQHIDA